MLHILLLLLALSSNSLGEDSITLSSENEFTDFVNSVNSKNDYSGTTVYLGTDITLTGNIDPIGKDYYQFCGIFDGQGHVISSLTINSSSLKYTGLFGFSRGLTIRNVVLDDSCSITSTFTENANVRVGGIIGECYAYGGECNIENSVNMASVSFSGKTTGDRGILIIGGIVGWLYSTSYNAYVKNCVNYGSVTGSGTASENSEIGGIVGEGFSRNSRSYNCYIQNCINYGTITHNGTSGSLTIGGAVGSSNYTYIENYVSSGKVVTQTTASRGNYVGSIVGYIDSSNTFINYCYYTSDVGLSNLYGAGTPSTTETPTSSTDMDSDLVSNLNSNATSCNWDNWFMLHLNGGSINNLTQELLVEIQGHIPNPVKEGNSFLFWCKDAECIEEFDPETDNTSEITDLYAAWTPNNYTVTFDANDGNVSETSKTVTFNEKYGELPSSKKEGYMFLGWFTSETNGTEVTNETIVTVPHNHTLYAHWEEVTNQVEIVFSTKDLTQEEAKNIIKQYTNADFTIEKFENESGEIRIVIKFLNKKEAEEFVRDVSESDEATNIVKKIGFDQGIYVSFSTTTIYPLTFISVLFL